MSYRVQEEADMKVLVVGSGGREHAIVTSVAKSPRVDKIYCAPGNAGIASLAECVAIGAMEFDKLVAFAKEHAVDFTIVGMDDPLVGGIVDVFEAEGLKVYLCLDHHIMGPEAVHNNHKNMRILHRDGQRAYERTHSRAEFMSLIGRNYLDEEKQEEPKKDTKDGFMFLEQDCIGCFGASENQCERCEEKRHDKKTETLAD